MVAPLLALLVAAAADSATAPGDSAAVTPRRIVRQFPPVTVRAPLHDMRSSESVQMVSGALLRALPVDRLSDLFALKAGVVVVGEELHVRGGRAGETRVYLSGIDLADPVRGRAAELPLLALRSAEVITGAPDAEFGGALAGVLNAATVDPGERLDGELRWQSSVGTPPNVDRVSGRLGVPLRPTGLGLVASAEATIEDPAYPSLRSDGRTNVLGASLGWRAENHALGYLKLAPRGDARPFALELLVNRRIAQPFDPMWSLDGWTTPELPLGPGSLGPGFSPDPVPGFERYRAADHKTITDDRRAAAIVSLNRTRARDRWSAALGWTHTRTLTSLGGRDDQSYLTKERGPVFGLPDATTSDPFHVYFGDEPYFRRARSTVLTARGDYERFAERGVSAKLGLALKHEQVDLRELDTRTWGSGLDSLRDYSARAPGASAYLQTRWLFEGLILSAGVRADYFTAGSATANPLAEGTPGGVWSASPRLGVAYPISTRDVFSLAYVRIQQDPPRDVLYDSRRLINVNHPFGNPALVPSTVISYQAAVKHLVSESWSSQAAVFYRDLFGQIGAREFDPPRSPPALRYENAGAGHAAGFELSLIRVHDPGACVELHYTYLDAFGSDSFEDGYPFGFTQGLRPLPIGEHPLAWDQRHTLALLWSLAGPRGARLSWSTVAGSGLPWTPATRRIPPADLFLVNSRRLGWNETSALRADWTPARMGSRLTFGLEIRNVFDNRAELAATLDGFPNSLINTVYDDYGAYRTETGLGGGAYWNDKNGDGLPGWIPVHDPRLLAPPRALRLTAGVGW